MTSLLTLFQPPAFLRGIGGQPVPVSPPEDLERLELLLPEFANLASRDPQEYALAYVERYQSNGAYLEHEWNFLAIAQVRAWQQEKYEVVARLAAALAYPAGRHANSAEVEQVLQLGIEASRLLHDTPRQTSLLNRLSCLLIARGDYQQGQQLWYTSFQLAESAGAVPTLWDPLASFAHIADILGNYGAAMRFAEHFQDVRQVEDPAGLLVALFARGFFARCINNLESAYEDLSACLRLLLAATPGAPTSPVQQIFSLTVQAELARTRGQYARSQAYTETALALAQIYSDHYTFGTLLIDQLSFSYQQGHFADTHRALLRLRQLTQGIETPHFIERRHFFEQRLAECLLESPDASLSPPTLPALLQAPTGLYEPLSAREEEVLQLVAAGLPNREIARQLVITPGTVKKHLEHIYTKLDTHNRTSAIARARALRMLP